MRSFKKKKLNKKKIVLIKTAHKTELLYVKSNLTGLYWLALFNVDLKGVVILQKKIVSVPLKHDPAV